MTPFQITAKNATLFPSQEQGSKLEFDFKKYEPRKKEVMTGKLSHHVSSPAVTV